jgi:predicted nuclease with TOPRIM domain
MAEESKVLKLFTTRMRQLILQYQETKKENAELCALVDQRDSEIKQLQEQLNQARNDYQSLQMAKMIEITDGDMDAAKKRIAGLIREVNKCITLLSDQ